MAVLDFLGAVASPVIGSVSGLFNNQANINAQKEAADLAYQRQVDQWNRQNEYDKPANQMSRFAAAGLNPNIIYGQMQNAESLPSVQQADITPGRNVVGDGVSDVLNNIIMFRRLANEDAQVQAQIDYWRELASKTRAETRSLDQNYQFNDLVRDTRVALMKSNLSESQQRVVESMVRSALGRTQEAFLNNQNQFYMDSYNDRLGQVGLQTALMMADIDARKASSRLNNARARQTEYDLAYKRSIESYLRKMVRFQIQGMSLDNKSKFLDNQYKSRSLDDRVYHDRIMSHYFYGRALNEKYNAYFNRKSAGWRLQKMKYDAVNSYLRTLESDEEISSRFLDLGLNFASNLVSKF